MIILGGLVATAATALFTCPGSLASALVDETGSGRHLLDNNREGEGWEVEHARPEMDYYESMAEELAFGAQYGGRGGYGGYGGCMEVANGCSGPVEQSPGFCRNGAIGSTSLSDELIFFLDDYDSGECSCGDFFGGNLDFASRYSGNFCGELTYYGTPEAPRGAGSNGACAQSFVPALRDATTVAINAAQWDDGAACGMCVFGVFNDGLQRAFWAIVDNLCPECADGDLDLGELGDGRWPLEWRIERCPTHDIISSAEGSNDFFAKVKFEGGIGAISGVECDGEGAGMRTLDNFWQFDGNGGFCDGLSCTITYDFDRFDSDRINLDTIGSRVRTADVFPCP